MKRFLFKSSIVVPNMEGMETSALSGGARLRIRISLVPYRSEHVEYDGRTMFHGAFPLQIFYTSPVPSRSWTIGLFAPEQIPAKACLPERLDCSIWARDPRAACRAACRVAAHRTMDRTKYRAVLTSVRQSQLPSERPCTDSGSDHPAAQAATLSRSVVCHRLFRTPQVWSALARNVNPKSHESRMYCWNEPIEYHYRPSYFLAGHYYLTTLIHEHTEPQNHTDTTGQICAQSEMGMQPVEIAPP